MIEKLKPLNVMNFLSQLQNFVNYCNDFYNNEYGIYPIASSVEIENAIGEYLTSPHSVDIQFDSFDREQVRNIIGK